MKYLPLRKIPAVLFFAFLICQTAYATPWAEKQTYGEKVSGKFLFGLRNSLLGWTAIFTEPWDSKYVLKKSEWEGFCDGVAKSVFYTANGLVHLVTFPVPVDFPDVGAGALPNLGKKGPPKPWEVHGKSKYRAVPAGNVVTPEGTAPRTVPEMPLPPAQTPDDYESSRKPALRSPVMQPASAVQTTVMAQPAAQTPPAAVPAQTQQPVDVSSRIK